MSSTINCPECGIDLSTVDPYKHAINCLHLPPARVEEWEKLAKSIGGNYATKVLFYVNLLTKTGE